MRRLSTLQALMVAGALTAACGDDSGGTGGEGGAGGRDGTSSSTTKSTTVTSGPTSTTSTMTTTTGSTTNSSASTGEGGMGTGGMGQGGSGTGGGGTGGGSGCIAITPDGFALDQADGTQAVFVSTFTPNIDAADEDAIGLQFYGDPFNGGDTGTFDLTMNDDDNYATCSRCFLAVVDQGTANPRVFFQSAGTLDIDAASTQLDGTLDAQVTNLTLIEVTIDDMTFVSTPVPGGACIEVAMADLQVGPQPGWTCNPANYGTNDGCDCGCGIVDPDCPDALAASCEYCVEALSCANDGTVDGCDILVLDPNNSAVCTGVPSAWDCDPADYNSGLANDCNCGCGAVDPDCADDTSASCDLCNDTGSCADSGTDCSTIDPTNNAECTSVAPPGWACDPDYYADGVCDCGCGVADGGTDCADATAASCDACSDAGSCAEDASCNLINDTNNAICVPLPAAWVCASTWFGTDDGCDCGCGAVDPDCANALVGSCEYCGVPSCANDGTQYGCDEPLINPTNNAVCL